MGTAAIRLLQQEARWLEDAYQSATAELIQSDGPTRRIVKAQLKRLETEHDEIVGALRVLTYGAGKCGRNVSLNYTAG